MRNEEYEALKARAKARFGVTLIAHEYIPPGEAWCSPDAYQFIAGLIDEINMLKAGAPPRATEAVRET